MKTSRTNGARVEIVWLDVGRAAVLIGMARDELLGMVTRGDVGKIDALGRAFVSRADIDRLRAQRRALVNSGR